MNALQYLIYKEKISNIAKGIGVSRMTIYNWTNGIKIRKSNIDKLSKYFNIPEEFFRKDELSESEKLLIDKLLIDKINQKNINIDEYSNIEIEDFILFEDN